MEFKDLMGILKQKRLHIILIVISIIQVLLCAFGVYKIYSSNLLIGDIGNKIALYITIGLSVWLILQFLFIFLKKKVIAIIIISITLLLCGGMAYYIVVENNINSAILKVTGDAAKNMTSLIVTKDESIKELSDLEGKTIGLLNFDESYEGYIIVHEEIEKNNIDCTEERVDSYTALISGLEDGIYDAIVLPTNYKEIFVIEGEEQSAYDGFIDAITLHKEIVEEKKVIDFGKPVTILLLGTDTPLSKNSYNYDSVTLVTLNLEKKHMLVTSVFRGTGIYSPCIGGADLLTHNGWGGNANCAVRALEDFFDIEIDSAVTMDFKGFVEIVNTLGGIEVDVEQAFCEQNSDRQWGSKTICLETGKQHIDGEEALAFARHRKTIGGIQRSRNQSQILTQIGGKLFSSDLLFQYNDLLKIISRNIKTEMTSNDIYKFYELMLSFAEEVDYDFNDVALTTQTSNGYDRLLYSKAVGSTMAINQITKDSYWNMYNTLHAVLDDKVNKTTTYSFDLSEDPDYDSKQFLSSTTKTRLKLIYIDPRIMPDLVGKEEAAAHEYDSKFAVFKVYVNRVYSNTVAEGLIISQSIPAGEGLNHRYKLTVTVSKGPDVSDESLIDLPNMIGESRSYIESWASSNELNNYSFEVVTDPEDITTSGLCFKLDDINKTVSEIYPSTPITFYIAYLSDTSIVPIITLIGDTTKTITVGDIWTDPGYSASDEIEGDVTSQIVITGTPVDTSVATEVTITYNLTINDRIAIEQTRTIVIEEDIIAPNNPVITLTEASASITYSEDSTVKKYRVTSADASCVLDWSDYTASYSSCTSDYTIEAYAEDSVGNISDTVSQSYTAPTE